MIIECVVIQLHDLYLSWAARKDAREAEAIIAERMKRRANLRMCEMSSEKQSGEYLFIERNGRKWIVRFSCMSPTNTTIAQTTQKRAACPWILLHTVNSASISISTRIISLSYWSFAEIGKGKATRNALSSFCSAVFATQELRETDTTNSIHTLNEQQRASASMAQEEGIEQQRCPSLIPIP